MSEQQPTADEIAKWIADCGMPAKDKSVEYVASRALLAAEFREQSAYATCPDSIKSMVESDIAAFTALRDGR